MAWLCHESACAIVFITKTYLFFAVVVVVIVGGGSGAIVKVVIVAIVSVLLGLHPFD